MAEGKLLSGQKVLIFAAGLALGLVVGFLLTNYLNRQELERSRAASSAAVNLPAPPDGRAPAADDGSLPNLTDEELQKAVERADAAPADAALQRRAGQALYLYAMEKQKPSILPDAARILRRAHEADPKDYNTTVLAANASFLLARSRNDPERLDEARRLYERALAANPSDVTVRTTLGLTYFYAAPPDPRRAVREYRRALELDPRHEMTLQSLAAALTEAGEYEEAGRRLAELEEVNASNPELANLRAQLEQKRNAAKERP
ncbi:MAG TPA: tetratricopeptide repeat protein [Pyrinomonadaceae bacterium]|nr:tetratricopeptide repeat protein [Pyrinomonadaceae bacterium]